MGTHPRKKSAPTLTEQQRRRQIIDLLAAHLARMPEAVAVSSGHGDAVGAGQSCREITAGSLNVSRFRGVAFAPDATMDRHAEKLSESGLTPRI